MIRHIVLFKFKVATEQRQIDQIVSEFEELPNKIDCIVGFESGTNVSPEQLGQGFTHAFVLTFPDAMARDAYLVDQHHREFVALLDAKLDDVLVFDFAI